MFFGLCLYNYAVLECVVFVDCLCIFFVYFLCLLEIRKWITPTHARALCERCGFRAGIDIVYELNERYSFPVG